MPDTNGSDRVRAVVTAASAVAANQLARDLSNDPSLQISLANTATNLWQQIDAVRPSVVLLDSHIAGADIPELVRDLLDRAGLPVLIRSDANENSPAMLLDCIEAGAIGILTKPNSTDQTAQAIPSLIWSLKSAATASVANICSLRAGDWPIAAETQTASILAIGAGMGGALALGNLLTQLPHDAPGAIVITALPARLIASWIDRLNERCKVRAKLARDGDALAPGQVLVAPGERHLLLRNNGSDWTIKIKDGPAVFYQKPSLDVLFNSIADAVAPKSVGVLLSSAGVDGIAGLLRLRKAGGRTLTESPASSLFTDLPTRALQCGAAELGAPANALAAKILELASTQPIPKAA